MPRRTQRKPKSIAGFLLNAHIPEHTAEFLRRRRYNVEKPAPGMRDYQVFQLAKRSDMVLITQDSKMRRHVSGYRHPGVVIIHGRDLGSEGVTDIVDTVLSVFRPIEDIRGQIIDISRYRVSITLPSGTRERRIPL